MGPDGPAQIVRSRKEWTVPQSFEDGETLGEIIQNLPIPCAGPSAPSFLSPETEMTSEQPRTGRRTLIGTVVSDKMEKTVVVEVTRRVLHGRYQKYVNRRKKY